MSTTKRKIFGTVGVILAAAVLLASGGWLGWNAGREYPKNVVISGLSNVTSTVAGSANFGTFWEAWQDINDLYLRTPSTTNQQKVYGAISGLVQSLGDPYTEFFTPADSQQFQQDITGDFGGIGAELGTNASGQIVIIAPLDGTPAQKAGLKPEDAVLGVNGSSTDGMSVDATVNLIRGANGTPVTLSILRSGWTTPKDFKMTRAVIQVPNVKFEMKGDIAHITLSEFTQDSEPAFYSALQNAVNANAKGIVLDMRNDPGGYLQVAVDFSGYFLKSGSLVVKEVGRTVPEQDYTASGSGALSTMPMAVLINSGSASAAEILSGALHDDRNIPLVGEKSFGKGTVQELETLSDGSSIKMTVAHWVLPSGRILDHDGLVPDYPVTLTDDNIKNNQDPQLDKAISVVQDEIAKGQ